MSELTREQILQIVRSAHIRGVSPDFSLMSLRNADFKGMEGLGFADFSGANLREADFSGANLTKANFIEANLCRANLYQANLYQADLIEADLSFANLNKADLRRADLSGANLCDANLSEARLQDGIFERAQLVRTNLYHTDLSQSKMKYTTFGSIDFQQVKGLEKIQHKGRSEIGSDTLELSQGNIPEVFLRGCGLSDLQIEMARLYHPNLTTIEVASITKRIQEFFPIQYYSCFISYSSQDEAFAQRLHDDLQQNGVRCWFAPEDIKGGRKLYPQIDEAIRLHDKLLLVLSENSLQSEWVMTEIRRARQAEIRHQRRKLFPIRLVDWEAIKAWQCFDADTGKDLAVEVREYFLPDFSRWKDHDAYQKAFERLLRDLKSEVEG